MRSHENAALCAIVSLVLYYDMGEIIGMQYNSSSNTLPEWSYLIRLLKSEKSSWLIGSDDGNFEYESNLVADCTSLEVKD
jgi:hypothetical protein